MQAGADLALRGAAGETALQIAEVQQMAAEGAPPPAPGAGAGAAGGGTPQSRPSTVVHKVQEGGAEGLSMTEYVRSLRATY